MSLVLGVIAGFYVGSLIGASHPLHTHRRSTLYIYKEFQHLLQWLVVIRMQLQPNICSMEPETESGCPWCQSWILCWFFDMVHPTQFILIAGQLYIYIKNFSTCYSG
jgi:hypothetical protein